MTKANDQFDLTALQDARLTPEQAAELERIVAGASTMPTAIAAQAIHEADPASATAIAGAIAAQAIHEAIEASADPASAVRRRHALAEEAADRALDNPALPPLLRAACLRFKEAMATCRSETGRSNESWRLAAMAEAEAAYQELRFIARDMARRRVGTKKSGAIRGAKAANNKAALAAMIAALPEADRGDAGDTLAALKRGGYQSPWASDDATLKQIRECSRKTRGRAR